MTDFAYCINWTEHERGWGSRPDGHTLHATREIAEKYRADCLAGQPKSVPYEYSTPGEIFLAEVDGETAGRLAVHGSVWGHTRQNRTALLDKTT